MKIRDAFQAPLGYIIVEIDYSQLETYCLAAITHDVNLVPALIRGEDLHQGNLEAWIESDGGNVEGKDRRAAKGLSFGLAYGETAFGMEKSKGIPKESGQKFIDGYYARFPGVYQWHESLEMEAEAGGRASEVRIDGYPLKEYMMETGYGKRYLFRQQLKDEWKWNKKTGNKVAHFKPTYLKNYPIQGIAADIIKFALARMWRVRKELFTGRGHLMNSIHDSIRLLAKEEHALDLTRDVSAIMTEEPVRVLRALGFDWPEGLELQVDAEYGRVWSEMTSNIEDLKCAA